MFSSVFLIGLSAAGRPLTSYLSPAWEAIGTFTYYPLKAWCWWGEWTSSWKIPAHLHISYLWLKSASLPLRAERCCLFYILKKKKSRGWNLTVGLSDNPHFHSAVTPPCHSAYITLGGLNASWWELILNSPALKTFFFSFFLKEFPFWIPTVWFLFQFRWADSLRDALFVPLLREGDETIRSYLPVAVW